MRIRVVDVLDLLSKGLNYRETPEELPDLEEADIRAAINNARDLLVHLATVFMN